MADPRQHAHALLNLYWFAAHAKNFSAQTSTGDKLRSLFRHYPDLVAMLQAEACILPVGMTE
jgi:hypothetical protein